ncbi:KaiC domain-containing protein [Halopelagius inordinatus]|uniref:KaiC domain-containing protein n=1 Tax=Halopelagius inordinatus TaxID=553467 RepID=UPI00373FE2A8
MGDDDDDWFERAFRDDDGEPSDGPASDADTETDSPDAERADAAGDDDAPSAEAESAPSAGERSERVPDSPEDPDDAGDANDSDPFGGVRDEPSEQTAGDAAERPPFEDPGSDSDPGDGGTGDDWNDFGSALDDAPGPGGEGRSGDSNPFGGDAGGFGMDEGFGGESGEFGAGGGEFGMGTGDFDAAGPPQSGPEEFDEENFESEIDRLDIGIDGLDEMILGGVPTRSLMVAIGSAGTGKTTLGLQFLNRALEDGDSAVFITLEESRTRILDTAAEKGWSFREHESEGRLAVVDLDPVEMANSLESIQNDLPRLVEEFGADRLVLDSVSLLEMMYDRPSKRRTRVFNFARSLKEAGVTTMLTSEASDNNPYVSRHGIVEYLADAVFVLQYVRPNDFRETRLAIEIQKIRDANHSRETKPYELTDEGISVYGRANIF